MPDCSVDSESRTFLPGVNAGSREKADGGGLYPVVVSRRGSLDACFDALDFKMDGIMLSIIDARLRTVKRDVPGVVALVPLRIWQWTAWAR